MHSRTMWPSVFKNSILTLEKILGQEMYVCVCIVHIYPPYTRKRIVSLYFGRDVRTRLGIAISEVSGPPVFHIKAGASR